MPPSRPTWICRGGVRLRRSVGPTNREMVQMEIVFKVAITAVLLCFMYYQLVFLRGVWRSQIDPGATIGRILDTLKPKTDVIATRDQNKIYQDGKVVGEVAVRAATFWPRVSTAAFKRKVESTPPEKATSADFISRRIDLSLSNFSKAALLASSSPRSMAAGPFSIPLHPR